ncbi:excinuclease ABC subunit UvrC [Oceanicella actignis]|uniref:UvrABC system protein C n=1 Tax=Oceanicella actignis TaxID=1189325 RepID=A0A1M7SRH9_9RHOB|nr:excinuclease ABC subunit UvrC [Oceanicella actignis]SES68141.1 Excinuclease ABC subunit C [Oceanicella actignis]SHN61167.1 Excinuclease ABC subunit C [Oceanicella actignis]
MTPPQDKGRDAPETTPESIPGTIPETAPEARETCGDAPPDASPEAPPEAPAGALPEAFEEEGAAPAPARGAEVIRSYLSRLPRRPGVYRMLDAKGQVLYVGKARDLRRRVSSYARASGHTARIGRMVAATASMMFLTTETEAEALLLEQNLIKQLKPRYNVLLRDDKSFPHILVTDHPFAQIRKHRGARRAGGRYFGPFAAASAVDRTLKQLQRVFQLRTCEDSVFENRTRPCLLHQIKRCSAPCVGRISERDYAASVEDAVRFLSGRSTQVQEELAAQMAQASAALEFERAAALRDRILALTQVQATQGVNPETVEEADVVALHEEAGQACVQVFFFRAHQNWGNRAYFPRTGAGASAEEIMEAFLAQFYADKTPARLVLTSHAPANADLLREALRARRGGAVELSVPRRGEKRALVDQALRNARESLARRLAEGAAQERLLEALAEAFGLPRPPRRIEVYDNSHIQGSDAIGAMIVAGPEGFEKSRYRKFNIKPGELTPGDDFAMMRQVLERRFARLVREDPARGKDMWPDLVLIDGGAGQVSAAAETLAALGAGDLPVFGVAKGEDRDAGKEVFHAPGRRPFALPHRSPVLYFVQRLRDEAHRFAIGTHRARRAKSAMANPLDQIPGVGPARKRALLAHFGSAKAVTRAGLKDLKAVKGVSEALAETIYAHFHPEG